MKKLFLALLVVALLSVAACPPAKVYVCKYVGQPGADERLQTGQNPIEVSVNAIKDFQGPGSWFADKQGRSYVLGYVGEEVGECPIPDNPPTPPTPPDTPREQQCPKVYMLIGKHSVCPLNPNEALGDSLNSLPARFRGTSYMHDLCRWGCDQNDFNWTGKWIVIPYCPQPCVSCKENQ